MSFANLVQIPQKICTYTSNRREPTAQMPIKYQRNCVRNSLFRSIEYTQHIPSTFGNGCIHARLFIFQLYDLVLCLHTRKILLFIRFRLEFRFEVMNVNVCLYVWVLLRVDECVSNLMHLKMISKPHKWENKNNNNSHRMKKTKPFVIFHIVFFIFVRNHNHIMRDNEWILFEQFTVWTCNGVSLQMSALWLFVSL